MNIRKPLYIAEISANHLGSLERARELVLAAIDAGANAIKLQTYTADTMTLDISSPNFRISPEHPLWGGKKLYDLYKLAYTPWDWHEELFEICKKSNVIGFSTPFDLSAVEFLEKIGVPMYKISSMETGDLELIRSVAETGKPIIVSTGATNWDEICELVKVVKDTGNKDLTLLLCTSAYPADPVDTNLRRMQILREKFEVSVGISDHTLGIGVSVAAIAFGASVIERHITLSEGNKALRALGDFDWKISESEYESRRIRRSLYIVEDVQKGDLIDGSNVRPIRPGYGCLPKYLPQLIGKRFSDNFEKGTPMKLDFAIQDA